MRRILHDNDAVVVDDCSTVANPWWSHDFSRFTTGTGACAYLALSVEFPTDSALFDLIRERRQQPL